MVIHINLLWSTTVTKVAIYSLYVRHLTFWKWEFWNKGKLVIRCWFELCSKDSAINVTQWNATFGIAFNYVQYNYVIETRNSSNSRSFSPRAAVIMTLPFALQILQGNIFKTKSLDNTSQRLRVLRGILLSGCFCLVFSFLLYLSMAVPGLPWRIHLI